MRFAVEPPTYETLAPEIGELDFLLFSGNGALSITLILFSIYDGECLSYAGCCA